MNTIIKLAGASIALGAAIGLAPMAHAAPSYTLTINGKQVDSGTDVRCITSEDRAHGLPPVTQIMANKQTPQANSDVEIETYTNGSSNPTINLSYNPARIQNVKGTTTKTGTGSYKATGTLQEMHARPGHEGDNTGVGAILDPGPPEPFEIDVTCP
jgi:hypothetical protein